MNKELIEAKKKADEFKAENNLRPVPDQGFSRYSGHSQSDQEYQHLFNILISLNLQLIEKVNQLTEKVNSLSIGRDCQHLQIITKKTEQLYKFWKPRQ